MRRTGQDSCARELPNPTKKRPPRYTGGTKMLVYVGRKISDNTEVTAEQRLWEHTSISVGKGRETSSENHDQAPHCNGNFTTEVVCHEGAVNVKHD